VAIIPAYRVPGVVVSLSWFSHRKGTCPMSGRAPSDLGDLRLGAGIHGMRNTHMATGHVAAIFMRGGLLR
jgi:hypothetical protein